MTADPTYKRHVSDLWPVFTDLFDVAERVVELEAHPGWIAVQMVMDAEMASIDAVLDGSREPKTQAEYAMAHGRRDGIRGAGRAMGAIVQHALAKRAEQEAKHDAGGESPADRG